MAGRRCAGSVLGPEQAPSRWILEPGSSREPNATRGTSHCSVEWEEATVVLAEGSVLGEAVGPGCRSGGGLDCACVDGGQKRDAASEHKVSRNGMNRGVTDLSVSSPWRRWAKRPGWVRGAPC